MPKNAKAASRQNSTTVELHPRGEQATSLLDSLEEELGLPTLFQEAKEEEEAPSTSGAPVTDARRVRQQPVDANLAGLFHEPKRSAANVLDGVDVDDVLGGLYLEDVDMSDDDGEEDDGKDGAPEPMDAVFSVFSRKSYRS